MLSTVDDINGYVCKMLSSVDDINGYVCKCYIQ